MQSRFLLAQLLDDNAWAKALDEGFDLPDLDCPPIDHLRGCLIEGMKREKAEVEAIVADPRPADFDNTIVALSKSGAMLGRATEVMYNLFSAETNEALDALTSEMSPLLTAHDNEIMLNKQLFDRVNSVYEAEMAAREEGNSSLTPEQAMLLQKTYAAFRRSGALLDEEGKEEFRALTTEISEQSLLFSQHLLADTHAFYLHLHNEEELAGLPALQREAAKEAAHERGLDGWVITLEAPSYQPFMTYADNRRLRRSLYMAYMTRCTPAFADALQSMKEGGEEAYDYATNDNLEIVRRIVNCRQRLARLLGYSTYADYALERRMAENKENVNDFLQSLLAAYLPAARHDVERVNAKAKALEGDNFEVQAWDFAYYAQKLREELYQFDPDKLRPYFPLPAVKKGVFGLATKLYGLTFEPAADIPAYHDDVETYRVFDEEHRFLAVLYMDFFPSKTKKGGAWMTSYRDEHADVAPTHPVTPENSFRPVVSVTTNFTKPTGNKPPLLSFGEVETLLHEFGHALHGIFAMTHYAALSGTSVFWDFVELPSQFMEAYALEPDFLSTFAFHYETGEPLPSAYVEALRAASRFNVGYLCVRQLSFGYLDMALHTRTSPLEGDVVACEQAAMQPCAVLPAVPATCMTAGFSHIMAGGYAAGYYSYKWADILAADTFDYFAENGLFSRAVAQLFRTHILSQGGTVHPAALYLRFRGRKPGIDALLKRDGISKPGLGL